MLQHGRKQSTLRNLKQKLEPVIKNQFYIGDDDGGGGSNNNNNNNNSGSSSQQHVVTNQNENPSMPSSLVDEFEGSFQSKPFEQPEVKQTLARDYLSDHNDLINNRLQLDSTITTTTETTNSRNVFIVD